MAALCRGRTSTLAAARRVHTHLWRRLTTRVATTTSGKPVTVQEGHALEPVAPRADSSGGDLTGLRVWEAASPLISYLDRHRHRLLHGTLVLELGAGTGAVGIAAAAFGASHVVLTEADSTAALATESGWQERSMLQTLAENVALNDLSSEAVSIAELRWGSHTQTEALRTRWQGGFGTVVASDVLYYPPATYAQLADAIERLTAPGGTVVLSYKVRHGEEGQFLGRLLGTSDREEGCGSQARGRFELVAREGAMSAEEAGVAEHGSLQLVELIRRDLSQRVL